MTDDDSGAQFMVGDQVGSYRIIRHVVAHTYHAVHVGTSQRVLLELAPPESWREVSTQMWRAQRLVASLEHPGIARIIDRGMLADRRPWIATAVPSGTGLYDEIARREVPSTE